VGSPRGCGLRTVRNRQHDQRLAGTRRRRRADQARLRSRPSAGIFPGIFWRPKTGAGCAGDGPCSPRAHRVGTCGMWRAAVHCTLRGTTSGDEIGRRAVLEQSRARSSWLFGTGSASTGRAPKGKDDLSRDATSVRSGNRRSRLQAEVAEREAFEARFPPETFSGIAEAIGLPPEPEILSGLRARCWRRSTFSTRSAPGKARRVRNGFLG
jgi:hypothetical protein